MAALISMIVLFLLWFFVLLPPTHPLTIASIHIVPLLLFLPAILRRNPRSFAWLCFVVLLYFCQGSVTAFALPQLLGKIGLTEALLTTWLFCASMMASRYHGQLAAQS
ncbi:DUF2069 domain-containing protein [Ketobacter nezhaii]|uniref:DUF2069 domain-containing protein n=1 Tax=Ketobacter sp. MCCC 1A13808 TaxID=2602738 RepID=UPI00210811C8|nr:DUF2069 domain-containing protein [Ketobacter sp. MCCC 1A13808]